MSSVRSQNAETQVTVIVIGAGERGQLYCQYALELPERLKVVGVADPKEFSRNHLQKLHNIPEDKVFDDWSKVISYGKFADAVIITTPDKFHRDIAVAFANEGYHILLEKPMATTEQGCRDITEACLHNGVMLSVCHVLRHYPPMRKIKEMIDSGAVGEVINIQHIEQVGYWHFAHSFVRGNWCCEEKSTFSLLAKCCHDVDLLSWWMNKYRCTKVSSFGSLSHFRKENKPNGASSRCLDCKIEQDCCYSAKKIYLDMHKRGISGWPVSVICDTPSVKSITDSLQHGPYGRCVYDSDNDVCDNQVVNLSFSGGQTATLTMVAFTESLCQRVVRVFGTKGELNLNADGQLQLYDFLRQQTVEVQVETPIVLSEVQKSLSSHAIADYLLMDNFVEAVARKDPSIISTSPEEILTSHLLVFQAEKARRESCVISLDDH
ncbi:putative oxidoreductase YteT [Asterias rubens]|uniref:putative oxidoreductase YteT n=1 Tax=Asterias rubens TaxID=7604 RepID=UPI001455560D|nr:putative oxidoreductase YteT [Asterias rubens]XP_033642633.1 putative oxidoreductase YteT [Asterias rubens]XP_033642634.1 putative oxidoreductase YteT [Asterias rubens]